MLDVLCLTPGMTGLALVHNAPRRSGRTAKLTNLSPTHRQVHQLPARAGRRITLSAALAAALLAAPAVAQNVPSSDPTPHQRSIAAGYKAAMLCSGLFVAGRSQAQVEATELNGIYPEYDAVVPTLPAKVNRRHGWVEVEYDKTMPPRLSMWRPNDGCTTYEPGLVPPPMVGDVLPLGHRAPPTVPDPRPWPVGDARIAPRPSAALSQAVARAFDGRSYGAGRTVGVLILRDGQVAAERYASGFGPFVPNRTWSVAKSIAGTLVGIARVDVNARANIPEWPCRGVEGCLTLKPHIKVDQLLRMTSGLHSDTAGNRTDAVYFGGVPVTRETVAWPLETRPGARFRYSNNDILLAMRSLRATLGEERYRSMPSVELFQPLGMTHTTAEKDGDGNYILSSQVWSTARDLARLGQFWLQDGVWRGKRLLPEGWMKYMTTPSGPQPSAGPGYGATLWLFGSTQGLPQGSYAAQGNRGQYVMVVPSAKLVIVRRGEDPGGARFDIAKFSADVLATSK